MGFRNKEIASLAGKKSTRAGIPNKSTQTVREAFQLLIENNLKRLQADLDKLDPKSRLQLLVQISKFVLPQLQAVALSDLRDKEDLTPVIIEIRQYDGSDPTLNNTEDETD